MPSAKVKRPWAASYVCLDELLMLRSYSANGALFHTQPFAQRATSRNFRSVQSKRAQVSFVRQLSFIKGCTCGDE